MRIRKPDEWLQRKLAMLSQVSQHKIWGNVPCREIVRPNHNQGYHKVWDGVRLQYAHRLAYQLVYGATELDVLHHCDNPCCIEPVHLFKGTQTDNNADRHAKGRTRSGGHKLKGRASSSRGERHGSVKLTETQVREIKRLALRTYDRCCCPAALARQFGVSDSLIRGILDGRNWGWLR